MPLKLVMALSEWAYLAKRIPGRLHFGNLQEVSAVLNTDDEIVVYCSGPDCASRLRPTCNWNEPGSRIYGATPVA